MLICFLGQRVLFIRLALLKTQEIYSQKPGDNRLKKELMRLLAWAADHFMELGELTIPSNLLDQWRLISIQLYKLKTMQESDLLGQ
jgi:hypothetical protein